MSAYIVRRLLLFIPTLFGVTLLIFVLVRVTPGDVADAFVTLESGGGYTREEQARIRERIRAEVGLDRPLYVQYVSWLGDIANGSFGHSYWQKRPVAVMIRERISVTVELAFLSLVLSLVWAIPAGVLAAVKQNSWIDQVLRVMNVAGLSIPNFWMGVMLIFFLATIFNWLPPLMWSSLQDDPKANMVQIALPTLILAYTVGAPIARLTRSEVLEALREDYVRTARAKGLAGGTVLRRHVLRNALLPVITLAGWSLGRMLGGVIVIETVFNLPGIGSLLVQSVALRDYDVVGAIVVILGAAFLVISLAVDILYGVIDPRVRLA